MAGDWIKMRAQLLQSPKLISVARSLHNRREFRDWLTPGGGGSMNGQVVSDDALRCVTGALLLRVWSAAREHGEFVGEDLFLPRINLSDLDVIAGVPGFGEAMAGVGWAEDSENGVSLPNFREYNLPMDSKDRQKAYRERHKKQAKKRVTESLPKARNENVTSLLFSSLVSSVGTSVPTNLRNPTFEEVWDRWVRHREEIRKPLKPTQVKSQLAQLAKLGHERAVAMIEHTIAMGWQGLREPETKRNTDPRGTFAAADEYLTMCRERDNAGE